MIARFAPRLQILPRAQRSLLPHLAPLRHLSWMLYSGTVIALRLGHRPSVDFDFFHEAALDRPNLYQALPWLSRATVLQDSTDTFTVVVRGTPGAGVKLSFFGRIDFGRIGSPALTADGELQVASMADLLSTKLKVVLQRVEAKDYRDIAALLRARVGLARGLAGARLLYGTAFQPSECLKALVYFGGGDLNELDASVRRTLLTATRRVNGLPALTLASHSIGDQARRPADARAWR